VDKRSLAPLGLLSPLFWDMCADAVPYSRLDPGTSCSALVPPRPVPVSVPRTKGNTAMLPECAAGSGPSGEAARA
jgi:hypothetical protein